MTQTWFAAFGLLALLCLVNAVVLVATLRQIGVLHQRIRPIGPGIREEGPQPGSRLPRLSFTPVGSGHGETPFAAPLSVIGYVSPGCGLCKDIPSFFRSYMDTRPPGVELSVALVTDADEVDAASFASSHIGKSVNPPLYRNAELQSAYAFPGSPYVVALESDDGDHLKVLAAGVVNELEQLEDLIDGAIAFREGSRQMSAEPLAAPGFPSAQALPRPPAEQAAESGATPRTESSPELPLQSVHQHQRS